MTESERECMDVSVDGLYDNSGHSQLSQYCHLT